jgi:hypothetical protein
LIDIDEMNDYYFTKKIYQGIWDLACYFGLQHEVKIDGAVI